MSLKYPNNVIVIAGVVAALLGATVLLSGFAESKEAVNDAETAAKVGCCPATGQMAACPQMAALKAESAECDSTPCTDDCPKPCCAGGNAEGACDNPCPIPCPKPCCAEDGCCGTSESAGCPMSAAEKNAQ
jgi:hypothetical protein